MKLIITLFGVLIVFAGISLVVAPHLIFNIFEDTQNYNSLYIPAIVLRVILGVLLLSAANQSKHPLANKILGGIALIAAISFIAIGKDGFTSFISELLPVLQPYARFSGLFALAFGAFLIYSFTGKLKNNEH